MKNKHILILMVIMLLFSCSPTNRHIEKEQENWCLPPLLKGTIPLGEEAWIKATMVYDDSTLAFPPRRWQKTVETDWAKSERVELLFVRETADDKVFWFAKTSEKNTEIVVYDYNKEEFKTLLSVENGSKIKLDSAQGIWISQPVKDDRGKSQLFRFNDTESTLELLKDDLELLVDATVLDFYPVNDENIVISLMTIQLDYYLILLNPTTTIVKIIDSGNDFWATYVDSDENIFAIKQNSYIYRFDNAGNSPSIFKVPNESYTLGTGKITILFNEDNRVILNDYGWFNNDDGFTSFEAFFRSPVFVTTNNYNGYAPYEWQHPEILAATNDDRLWYRSYRGLAWFQPETGQWCMFTNANSNIVKDRADNLWILYENDLYMLPASETQAKDE